MDGDPAGSEFLQGEQGRGEGSKGQHHVVPGQVEGMRVIITISQCNILVLHVES